MFGFEFSGLLGEESTNPQYLEDSEKLVVTHRTADQSNPGCGENNSPEQINEKSQGK